MTADRVPLLRVTELHKHFGALAVLKGVSFDVAAGARGHHRTERLGKSTCLRGINYLSAHERPHRTRRHRDRSVRNVPGVWRRMTDTELAPQRAQIGMVFQLFHLWPHLTARDNVALQPQKVGRRPRSEALEIADAMLAKVHMSHKRNEYPERLSGGQQQRVAIARALAQQPKLLLFDEPTSALDPELVGEVLNVIHELAEEGRSMLLVTHEIRFAREVANRVLFMDDGLIVEHGDPVSVLGEPGPKDCGNSCAR